MTAAAVGPAKASCAPADLPDVLQVSLMLRHRASRSCVPKALVQGLVLNLCDVFFLRILRIVRRHCFWTGLHSVHALISA